MNIFRLKLRCDKSDTLRKILTFNAFLLCWISLNAQNENRIKLRIEPGILILNDSKNLGLLLNVEPKIKISESTVIGFRFGVALNSQKIKINNSSRFFVDEQGDNGVISFMPTFDYYLNEDKFRPYIGLGLGYYAISYLDVSRRNGSAEILKGEPADKVGFLVRSGFEFGNTRVGLEYNFIPKADIKIPDGRIIGTVNNSYLGLIIGFVIGGRKSRE